jgi:nucleotide-binding universal stress UspA family protein
MFDSILLPIDGTPESSVVVEHATAVAAAFDATLHVLNVVDVRALETAPESEDRREDAATLVSTVADDVEAAGVAVETAVRTAMPWDAILEYASENAVDLVTMGTHARRGVERFRLGSVAESVLRESGVPVLVVPVESASPPRFPYRNVLVPTDGSAEASAASELGIDLAATLDASVHVLSVVETDSLGPDVRSQIHEEELHDAADAYVDRVAGDAAAAGVEASATVATGVPYAQIREYVDAHDVDLVAMGTHGRSGVDRYLLGSVTERVLRTVGVPVLAVHADSA